jgi:uncharacterized protein (TIGR02117 family)
VKHRYLLLLILLVTACSGTPKPCTPVPAGEVVYVVEQGWHAEIGIPVKELKGEMTYFKDEFPGAEYIMFGYGKKTFFTAPPNAVSEYFIGPFPGTGAIHAVGLNAPPTEAYGERYTTVLHLPKGGSTSLSNFIWDDLAKDKDGKPTVVARSKNPDGLFYAAESRYNMFHTCNTWTADALQDAGLPVSGNGVVFAGGVMSQVAKRAAMQCGN